MRGQFEAHGMRRSSAENSTDQMLTSDVPRTGMPIPCPIEAHMTSNDLLRTVAAPRRYSRVTGRVAHIALSLCSMTTRWVHLRVDEELHERMRQAAHDDRRSLANWVAVACERALKSVAAPDPAISEEVAR